MTTTEILARLQKVKVTGQDKWQACCPAHDDNSPSMGITIGNDGRTLMHCHAGCTPESIVTAMGLKMSDLFAEPRAVSPRPAATQQRGKIVATWDYHDELGNTLFTVCRIEPGKDGRKKDFFQKHKDPTTGKDVWNMDGVRRVLYRLPEVLKEKTVWIVEGERKADELHAFGFMATCNVGGAGKWIDAYTEILRGKAIVICGDNDTPGQNHVKLIHEKLSGAVESITHVRIPKEFNDVADYTASLKASGKDEIAIFAAINDLVDAGTPCPVVRHAQIQSMAELEAEYSTYANTVDAVGLRLGAWLSSLSDMRPIVPGELVTVLAETGVGKTMILHNIAARARGLPTLLFEIELPGTLTFERVTSLVCNVSGSEIESTYASGKRIEWQKSDFARRLFVCSESNLTVEMIRKLIVESEAVMGTRPVLVMFDYLQLVSGNGEKRYEKMSNIAEQLKVLAKQERVIVVAASQVHRKDGKETNERITLHDAKDSGSIENSSGIVIGAWRDPEKSDRLMVSILKNTKGKGANHPIACKIDFRSMRIEEEGIHQ